MTLRDGEIESDGARIHYLDWGGDGPPLLLIHATGFLAALWRPIAERLCARLRVVAIDQRGHGDSEKPDGGYRFEQFADDTQRVIEELDLERPLAAGHSSGGTTLVMHTAAHPGVLQRVALIEPILPRPDWFAKGTPSRNPNSLAEGARKRRAIWPSRDEMLEAYRTRPAFETWREDLLRLYVEEGTLKRPDGQVELKCPPDIEAQFFEAVTRIDAWAALPSLTFPALVLWGEKSHLHARGLAEQLDEALPSARTVLVDDTTHFLPQERPDEVARLMEEFLAD